MRSHLELRRRHRLCCPADSDGSKSTRVEAHFLNHRIMKPNLQMMRPATLAGEAGSSLVLDLYSGAEHGSDVMSAWRYSFVGARS